MSRLKFPTLVFLLCALVLGFLFSPSRAAAAPIDHFPVQVSQPDGSTLLLYASGDEYQQRLTDAAGFTVMPDPSSGYYVYAELRDGLLVPGPHRIGSVDPLAVGLQPGLAQAALPQPGSLAEISPASVIPPVSGNVTNLVIFVRFAGEAEFSTPTSSYTSRFNDTTAGANSLYNYFKEVSYGSLLLTSNLYPTPASTIKSYQDSKTRAYFEPYDAATNPGGYADMNDRTAREQLLIARAVKYVYDHGLFPGGKVIDSNLDGFVDSLTIVVKGGTSGRGTTFWPHQWPLYTQSVLIGSKSVYQYAFHVADMATTGVLAHEMYHILGAPDLYRYFNTTIDPVGGWDVMDTDADIPQHMGCYMKYRYGGWIGTIPEITTAGQYTLNPLTSPTGNCYLIKSPNSSAEYFVLEYRRALGTFESSLPGSGLLVYRINPARRGNVTTPDEVYLFRPDGSLTVNGTVSAANFSSEAGRTAINDSTNPATFLMDGSAGGLRLCNIGSAGATISFEYCPSASSLQNDAITSAEVIRGLSYSLQQNATTATRASDDPALSCLAGAKGERSLWFSFTPALATRVLVDTFGSAYDTALAVYSGAPGSLVSVGCNDNARAGLQSRLEFSAQAGKTYTIEVVSKTTTAGSLSLHAYALLSRTIIVNPGQDGDILETSETSGKGGTTRPGAPAFLLGDDALNRQYRAILGFDTSVLPDNAVLTSAQVRIYIKNKIGTYPFKTHGALLADIRKPYFGAGQGLGSDDFSAAASLLAVASFPSTDVAGWHIAPLVAGGLPYVNKTGATQFRLRFRLDDDGDFITDLVSFYSGDYSGSAYHPRLVITYYIP